MLAQPRCCSRKALPISASSGTSLPIFARMTSVPEIIGHLRGFLRADKGSLDHVSISRAVADVLHIVEPEAARRGIVIDCDQVPEELVVRADRVHLPQVLLNLALNGMDAMKDGASRPRIVFQATQIAGAKVEVAVLDTGIGIPEGKLSEIFRIVRDDQEKWHRSWPFDCAYYRRNVRRHDLGREPPIRGGRFCFVLPLAKSSA